MRAVLPHPLLSMGLFVASVLLSDSLAPPSLVLGVVMALAAPQVMRAMRIEPVSVRAPLAIITLAGRVAVDILRSNLAVAQILAGRRADRVSGFIHIPLDLKARYGLAVLAIIITSTPGTLWVEYDRARGRLLMHVLDLVGEETWVRIVKDRYERLLMEIFE
ncbi:MAG: Na+/H+ antiporter subunit E [Brevundimonas sp.]|uniref:Na+/H+ antiporter subunit E n=1 Tax=Brevundimonas sp. TaxID=1871086 RepID=UPI0012033C9D|nr:Na+/H+ antiporter subunit E [Brevundimonas sp.]RZJ18100.1 MAG: Na+/H+ antiporter subunit E [Brevundimonas sp.]